MARKRFEVKATGDASSAFKTQGPGGEIVIEAGASYTPRDAFEERLLEEHAGPDGPLKVSETGGGSK